MAAWRRRGRPRREHEGYDAGTPELQARRQRGETAEALDLCFARGLITADEHWCGVHLRWLHTLRYGAPGLRSVHDRYASAAIRNDDIAWRSEREKEYNDALLRIGTSRGIVLRVAIHDERPSFLRAWRAETMALRLRELHGLQHGLGSLTALWCRRDATSA